MREAYLNIPGTKPAPTVAELNQKRVDRNRKRSNRVSNLKREANKLCKQMYAYLLDPPAEVPQEDLNVLEKCGRQISTCATHSLYREHFAGDAVEYIGSATCKHKICPICNSERSKKLRRKWMTFLTDNPELLRDYDPMHLTLTVPHTAAHGFRGEQFYAMTLINIFKELRREVWFSGRPAIEARAATEDKPARKGRDEILGAVHGGEYGVEVTRNENGLHFHIHSLLFVRKGEQNRNHLHRQIMLAWNWATLDQNAQRQAFGPTELAAIKKGNKLLDDADLAQLIPQGSTLIGLESLFVLSDTKKGARDVWQPEKKQWKHYVNANNIGDLISGVMECLKYHFEPLALKKHGTADYDFALLVELLPKIFRKPLYQKFGAFRGVKELNINPPKNAGAEADELLADFAHDEVINPDTLREAEREEYTYFVASVSSVYHFNEHGLRPYIPKKAPRMYLHESRNLGEALRVMIDMSISKKT